MSISRISALFTTISGCCAAVGTAQAFQVFGNSTPTGHKVTSGIMLVSVVFAYLANSPFFKPAAVVAEAAAKAAAKAGVVALLLLSLATGMNCAHVQPIAACATDAIVAAIEDALTRPDWEAELEQLVVADGPSVVECVIEQIIAQSGSKAGADVKVEHAKAWKAKHSK